MIGKITSLVIALAYLFAAYFGSSGETAFKVGMFLLLPLACIWFSEAMGSYTGSMRGQYINATTPGGMVAFGGWLLLLMPLIIAVINFIRQLQQE